MSAGWKLLQSGRCDEAIVAFEEEDRLAGSPATRLSLVLALLCAGRLDDANSRIGEILNTSDASCDTALHLAGTASWLLGTPAEAIDFWYRSLQCQYTDAAGGILGPCLLCFAASREPSLFQPERAREILEKRLRSPRSEKWPGQLGKLLVGRMDENWVRSIARLHWYTVAPKLDLQVTFYAGVLASTNGDDEAFIERMRQCAVRLGIPCCVESALARFEAGWDTIE